MDFLITKEKLEAEIWRIEQTFLNKLSAYNEIISYCREILESYRKEIRLNDFQDIASEILFFKVQKTLPLTYLIYYEIRLSIELEMPTAGEVFRQKVILKMIETTNRFFSAHKNFLQYMALEQEYMDEFYFTRRYFSKNHMANYRNYERDPLFSTSHDLLLSELNSHKLLLQYLNKLSVQVKHSSSIVFEEPIRINWTSSKVALTELVYALQISGAINNGNTTLKELFLVFEILTGLDMGDYHHTFLKLRGRSEPLKFIEKMKNSMVEYMEELDS